MLVCKKCNSENISRTIKCSVTYNYKTDEIIEVDLFDNDGTIEWKCLNCNHDTVFENEDE